MYKNNDRAHQVPYSIGNRGETFTWWNPLMESIKGKDIKKPTTFKEQIELLKSRNLLIPNEEEAINILQRINYYRLTGYILTYKEEERYGSASIHDVYALYLFDKELRNLISSLLEDIEIAFRTHISYLIAHQYGALGYKDHKNFKNEKYHADMLRDFEDGINRSNEAFVEHHRKKYDGEFPIWVVIELTTFGVLSKMYSNLMDKDQDKIANEYYNTRGNYVRSWLYSLSYLRNTCAHYGRLYNRESVITPKLFKSDNKLQIRNDTLFANICVMGRLLMDKNEWNRFVTNLAVLVGQYSVVDIERIGFPKSWENILRHV